jgi:hypothetical protein
VGVPAILTGVIGDSLEALRAAYQVFRRERSPGDVLPPVLAQRSLSVADPAWGLDAELSRVVRRAGDGRPWFLVPGDDVVGFYDERGSGFVLGLEQALTGENVGSSFRGTGRLEVTGLLPDGATDVMIMRRNGEGILMQIPDHVYCVTVVAATADQLPSEVRYALGGHEHRVSVPGADDGVLSWRSPNQH